MAPDALIGYTGFIGSNLLQQRKWDNLYNSKNIKDINGSYGTIVCCGSPGTKWFANTNCQTDLNSISLLMNSLEKIIVQKMILISTADVFGQPVDADENTVPNPDCPYGKHRLILEKFIQEKFASTIVRLPNVIGPNMKKGPYYDLNNCHRLNYLNPESVYQWYNVNNLWKDIMNLDAGIIHLCPQPISLKELCQNKFPNIVLGNGPIVYYNLRTKYGCNSN